MQTDQTAARQLHSASPGVFAQNEGAGREASAIVAKVRPIIAGDYVKSVVELIRTATRSIDVCSYAWKWYGHQMGSQMQKINYAVIERARQGLPVRIRLNSEEKDHYLTKENSRTASAFRRYPIQIKFDSTQVTSHLKMIIIDNEIVIIGSHNLTTRSVCQNNEASVAIFGREACRDFVEYFNQLWS